MAHYKLTVLLKPPPPGHWRSIGFRLPDGVLTLVTTHDISPREDAEIDRLVNSTHCVDPYDWHFRLMQVVKQQGVARHWQCAAHSMMFCLPWLTPTFYQWTITQLVFERLDQPQKSGDTKLTLDLTMMVGPGGGGGDD